MVHLQPHRRQATERSDVGNRLLPVTLLQRPLLSLGCLEEHLQLALVIGEHPLLGRYAGLKIQNGLLVTGPANGPYQLLDTLESTTDGCQSLLCRGLEHGDRLPGSDHTVPLCR